MLFHLCSFAVCSLLGQTHCLTSTDMACVQGHYSETRTESPNAAHDRRTFLDSNGKTFIIDGRGSQAIYEAISNQSENCHVHDRPGRTPVVDSRQLISFTFSVQTGQLVSLGIMTILTLVGYCLIGAADGLKTSSIHVCVCPHFGM